ncbi:MAG: glycosyltransferase family 4 protein [Alphaproteobacteria bacterium]|jgi:UDP-N-acetylmuramyl pentapeptide phosphotransferase/UDP-N-acetylglucosamine-1-phosphate transferase|nr:glycosyltransferase family 4 protein [Alphaproteobacteria bacterium]
MGLGEMGVTPVIAWSAALAVGAGAFVTTALGTWLALIMLRRRGIVDQPNDRSSHTLPTPRGGGIAVVAVLLAAWIALWATGTAFVSVPLFLLVPAGALGLAALSWIDDLRGGIPAAPRFALQIIAVAAGLFALPEDGAVLQGIVPFWADRLIAALLWLWFINLFNFMDGIDGITGSQTATIGLGVFVIGFVAETASSLALPGLAVGGVAAGFLMLNWRPAKIFMGDVGSVPLGHLVGWLLLTLSAQGHWHAALLLPAYYLADASLTLARRIARGDKPWEAHREHAYQVAILGGRSHSEISLLVAACGIALAGLALAGLLGGAAIWITLAVACVLVVTFLWYLSRQSRLTAPGDKLGE